jgi:hypothetical protein
MAKMASKYGYVPVHIHLDDMILLKESELKQKNYEIPSWENIYPKSNVDLYKSHANNIFDPKMWITPDF